MAKKIIITFFLCIAIILSIIAWDNNLYILVKNNSINKIERITIFNCQKKRIFKNLDESNSIEIVIPLACAESQIKILVHTVKGKDPYSFSGGYYTSSMNYRDIYSFTDNGILKEGSEPFLPFIGTDPLKK